MTFYPIANYCLPLLAKVSPLPLMPTEASVGAGEVDFMLAFIFLISAVFFVLIVGFGTYFVIRYRRGRVPVAEKSAHHNMPLEITWTIIPLVLVMVIFYYGFKGYLDLVTPPENAFEINVEAHQWKWLFVYPGGVPQEDLHVPLGRPVVLTMTSIDVIHSLYIPDFRAKKDVVPGRYTKVWFEASELGTYDLFCAEYCGAKGSEGHSSMLAKVIVHEPGEFDRWLADAANFVKNLAPADAGERLYKVRGCAQCHSIDGKKGIGPTFKNLFGETMAMKDGSKVTVEENYIRESILNPMAKVVAGFDPVMPTFQGKLNDREITAIIEYIKSISEEEKSKVMEAWPDEAKDKNEAGEEEEKKDAEPGGGSAEAGGGGNDGEASNGAAKGEK